jgi:hypothetical protein
VLLSRALVGSRKGRGLRNSIPLKAGLALVLKLALFPIGGQAIKVGTIALAGLVGVPRGVPRAVPRFVHSLLLETAFKKITGYK